MGLPPPRLPGVYSSAPLYTAPSGESTQLSPMGLQRGEITAQYVSEIPEGLYFSIRVGDGAQTVEASQRGRARGKHGCCPDQEEPESENNTYVLSCAQASGGSTGHPKEIKHTNTMIPPAGRMTLSAKS